MDKWVIKQPNLQSPDSFDNQQPSGSNLKSISRVELPRDNSSDESSDIDQPTKKLKKDYSVEKTPETPVTCSKVTKSKKHYSQLFCNSWLQEFKGNWLQKSDFNSKSGDEQAYCKVCEKTFIAHRTTLLRHSKSEKHLTRITEVANNKTIENVSGIKLETSVRRAELKLTGLLATNHLPFLLMDTLSPLCADIFPDSQIAKQLAVRRTKATALMTKSLGKNFSETLYEKLKEPGCFFSIVIDEQTDQGSAKQCAFTIIFYDNLQYKVETKFFDMIEMPSGTAEHLFNGLKKVVEDKNIPIQNLVGYSSDTTNVMFGPNHSVVSLLKQLLPDVVFIKCTCHNANTSVCYACMKLPRSVEDMVRNIGSHFSRSALRRDNLKEFEEFFQTGIQEILTVSSTRWLSLKQCVDRILKQFPALKAYFTELIFTSKDPSKTTNEILCTMNNKFTIIYLEFLSYALGLMTDFNLLFQSETPLLHRLKPEVEKLIRTTCSNYLEIHYVKNAANIFELDHQNPLMFLEDKNVYLGILGAEDIHTMRTEGNVLKQDVDFFYNSIRQFYTTLVSELKERYQFSDPVFDVIKILDPPYAQSFKVNSLQCVLKRFPILKEYVDVQKLDEEWRMHGLNHGDYELDSSLLPEEYWRQVFKLKNAAGTHLFKNLEKVIGLLLVLPFSNASVERLFSQVKLTKTLHRNNLANESLNAIMLTREGIQDCGGLLKFNPTKNMLNKKI